eukprot:3938166-Rhodomonas_salina.2
MIGKLNRARPCDLTVTQHYAYEGTGIPELYVCTVFFSNLKMCIIRLAGRSQTRLGSTELWTLAPVPSPSSSPRTWVPGGLLPEPKRSGNNVSTASCDQFANGLPFVNLVTTVPRTLLPGYEGALPGYKGAQAALISRNRTAAMGTSRTHLALGCRESRGTWCAH